MWSYQISWIYFSKGYSEEQWDDTNSNKIHRDISKFSNQFNSNPNDECPEFDLKGELKSNSCTCKYYKGNSRNLLSLTPPPYPSPTARKRIVMRVGGWHCVFYRMSELIQQTVMESIVTSSNLQRLRLIFTDIPILKRKIGPWFPPQLDIGT